MEEEKMKEIEIDVEMLRLEVDNLKRDKLKEQRERQEWLERLEMLERVKQGG